MKLLITNFTNWPYCHNLFCYLGSVSVSDLILAVQTRINTHNKNRWIVVVPIGIGFTIGSHRVFWFHLVHNCQLWWFSHGYKRIIHCIITMAIGKPSPSRKNHSALWFELDCFRCHSSRSQKFPIPRGNWQPLLHWFPGRSRSLWTVCWRPSIEKLFR